MPLTVRLADALSASDVESIESVFWNDAEAFASSGASASCYDSAENVRIHAIVMTESELGKIERQIFRRDVVIGADDFALQQTPEAFDVLGMHFAAYILVSLVIDRLMICASSRTSYGRQPSP